MPARRSKSDPAAPKPRAPRGEGTVKQRKDGRWYAAIPMPPDGTGKRRREYAYCPADNNTEKEAYRLKRELLNARDAGRQPADKQTLAQWLVTWFDQVVTPGGDPNTIKVRRRDVARWTAKLGALKLATLGPEAIQRTLNEWLTEGYAPRTVAMRRETLVTALNQAIRWRLLDHNPATLTRRPRVTPKPVMVLSPEQARAFLAAAQQERLGALFTVALTVGLRRGEAMGLRWSDIDLEAGTLTAAQQLQFVKGQGLMAKLPKSRRTRTMALPAVTLTALRAHRTAQLVERLAAGPAWTDTGLVFTTTHGTNIWPTTVDAAMARITQAAGVSGLTPHGLRHSCATLLLAQGVPERVIAETLGHSSTALLKVYARVGSETQRKAATAIDDVVNAAPATPSAVEMAVNAEQANSKSAF